VSPNWYPAKQEHHKVVPTWDYAVVHAHGHVRAIEGADWLLKFVGRLSDIHEASQPRPWSIAEAPRDYLDKLVERIVGIEMPIVRLEGKWKAHQARPIADKLGTIAGLNAIGTDANRGVAEMIAATIPK
jgi:transcriptional regulator